MLILVIILVIPKDSSHTYAVLIPLLKDKQHVILI